MALAFQVPPETFETPTPTPTSTPTPLIQTPLKYPGGKRWLKNRMEEFYEPHRHRRWVSPFCGSCALEISMQLPNCWINDRNRHLMNFWRWVKLGQPLSVRFENTEESYTQLRDQWNYYKDDPDYADWAAQVVYILNRHTYNGLTRFNLNGEFNAPYGRYTKIPDPPDFACYAFIENWQLSHAHHSNLPIAPDDFIFADPPYDGTFTGYDGQKFHWSDQLTVAAWLAKHPGPVVATNHATDRIIALYEHHGFGIEIVCAPRSISRTGDRTPALEMIATKNV